MKTTGFLKKLFLLATLLMSGTAWAQVATVANLTGSAQAIPAVGAPRDLRQGDTLNQGETVVTKAMSSAVIRFEDGQIVALTANSRMAISNYAYNKMEPSKSSSVIALLEGGLRGITGLIGKAKPENVTYKAANATIGIRGTDVEMGTSGGDFYAIVNSGAVDYTPVATSVASIIPISPNVAAMSGAIEVASLEPLVVAQAGNLTRMNAGQGVFAPRGKMPSFGNAALIRQTVQQANQNLNNAQQQQQSMGFRTGIDTIARQRAQELVQQQQTQLLRQGTTPGQSRSLNLSGAGGSGSGGGSNVCPNGQPRPNPPSTC